MSCVVLTASEDRDFCSNFTSVLLPSSPVSHTVQPFFIAVATIIIIPSGEFLGNLIKTSV